MDKNKIILTYLDFVNGKFMSSADRINFDDTKKHAINFIENKLNIEFDNTRLMSNYSCSKINRNIVNISESLELSDRKNLIKSLEFVGKYNYFSIHANKKYHITNENIYAVSNKIYDYFINIPLPENFNEIDYIFTNDLPALFVFESGQIGYLTYLSENGIPELNLLNFGDNFQKKYFCNYISFEKEFLLNSFSEKYYDSYEKSLIENATSYIKKAKDLIHFMCNILLFLKVKDTMSLLTKELNPVINSSWENIKQGKNTSRNEQIIKQAESYKFVDLDLTLSEYSNEYQKAHAGDYTSSKKPHWRIGHWHSYWTGERGTESQKRIIKFIPTIWIGDPSQKQDTIIFKSVK